MSSVVKKNILSQVTVWNECVLTHWTLFLSLFDCSTFPSTMYWSGYLQLFFPQWAHNATFLCLKTETHVWILHLPPPVSLCPHLCVLQINIPSVLTTLEADRTIFKPLVCSGRRTLGRAAAFAAQRPVFTFSLPLQFSGLKGLRRPRC